MRNRMKGFTCCGDCIQYNYKKHKCNLGASVETDVRNPFYDDCPIPDVPSEQEIRNKAIDEFAEKLCENRVSNDPVVIAVKSLSEQTKETEEPFFNFDSPVVDVDKKVIHKFAEWCYIHGIDFLYMSTAKKGGRQFIDDVIEMYSKEQMKEVGE